MSDKNYRERFYAGYVRDHWRYLEDISPESFKLVAIFLRKHIAPFLPLDKSAAILDIGCGPGHLLHFLQKEGYNLARGIDFGADQIKMAREMGVKNIEQADLVDYMQRCSEKFDVIICLSVIEHFTKEEAVRVLDLIYGALKPGGKLIMSTCNAMSLFDLESTFGDFTHEIVFTPRSFTQLLRACGFSDVQIYGMGPVVHDLRSALRAFMWRLLKMIFTSCALITLGTGRSIWKFKPIFESMILAVG